MITDHLKDFILEIMIFLIECMLVFRPVAGGQPVHQSHHSGTRSHLGGNQKWRSSGDRQDRTHDSTGAGM